MSASLPNMIGSYLAGVATLKAAVSGMFREHLVARPVAGKWSTLEVVCHIADFESILAARMKRILAEERPLLLGANETRFASYLAYQDRDLHEELAVVETTRQQMARILRSVPADALHRSGVHAERGLLTLQDVLASAINHIPHHVAFIAEKRKVLGLPTD